MGGSNGSGYGGHYPIAYENDNLSCLSLSFSTNLASVNPSILNHVKEGEVYNVVADNEQGPVYVSVEGNRLGTIIHTNDVLLLNCLFEGTEYQATITLIREGQCKVLIKAKQ